MAQVELKRISKSFGSLRVLTDIDLTVADGEFLTLVGPSGCGKSTLIRIIAGLEPQTAGSVAINGASIDHLRPHERRVAMVFQSYALYPHMSVFSNVALPLTMSRLRIYERLPLVRFFSARRRKVMAGIAAEVQAVAAQLQIEPLLGRRPAQLSGGQRQRVALGRAMVRHPDAFLMDEPLSNLDAKLRVHMRTELAELHQRLGSTFIYVTHDQVEAMTMSDRVAMMDSGHILQLGTPAELYERPDSIKVAQFIGSPAINLLPARIGDAGSVELFGRQLQVATGLPLGAEVTIGVRPEKIVPAAAALDASRMSVPARLRRRENLGSEQILHFDLVQAPHTTITSRVMTAGVSLALHSPVELTFNPAECHLFKANGRRLEPLREARKDKADVTELFRSVERARS